MSRRKCLVCGEALTGESYQWHTFHEPGCPARDSGQAAHCCLFPWCGRDVHEDCCPTCTDGRREQLWDAQ